MAAILFTLLAMCSTLAGGYLAIKAHHRLHLLMGLGAGVLLGAVFFDLLPESLAVASEHAWSFLAETRDGAAVGFAEIAKSWTVYITGAV